MDKERVVASDNLIAQIIRNHNSSDEMTVTGRYRMECVGADGQVKWVEEFDNMVVNTGKIDLLDKYFGAVVSTTNYLGLIGTVTGYDPTYTMATHTNWTEDQNYSTPATRGVPSWNGAAVTSAGSAGLPGTASTVSKATSPIAFTMNASTTINGAFLVNGTGASTKGGTTGTLISSGSFASGRAVISGDTLNVTYTITC